MPITFNGNAVNYVTYLEIDVGKVTYNGITVFEKGSAYSTFKFEHHVSSSEKFYFVGRIPEIFLLDSTGAIASIAIDVLDQLNTITVSSSLSSGIYILYVKGDGETLYSVGGGTTTQKISPSVKYITLNNDVGAISMAGLGNCSNLEFIELGENISSIGALGLGSCSSLYTIVCKSPSPPTLGGGH